MSTLTDGRGWLGKSCSKSDHYPPNGGLASALVAPPTVNGGVVESALSTGVRLAFRLGCGGAGGARGRAARARRDRRGSSPAPSTPSGRSPTGAPRSPPP